MGFYAQTYKIFKTFNLTISDRCFYFTKKYSFMLNSKFDVTPDFTVF